MGLDPDVAAGMELRQLRYFVTLAEELHFGRAAEREHIVQSALSQQVQRLERELGVRLLERSTHHVELTAAGVVFLVEARQILAHVDRADAEVRALPQHHPESLVPPPRPALGVSAHARRAGPIDLRSQCRREPVRTWYLRLRVVGRLRLRRQRRDCVAIGREILHERVLEHVWRHRVDALGAPHDVSRIGTEELDGL